MLKLFPTTNLTPASKAKCGEIFCQNFNDFTIFCTFCQMKSFEYDDFLQHLQNVHKTEEFNKYLEVNIINETVYEKEETTIWGNMNQPSDREQNEDDAESCEEEKLVVLKEHKWNTMAKKMEISKQTGNTIYAENSSDELKNQKNKSTKNDAKNLANSERKHKEIEYSCPECAEIFSQKKHLDHHVIDLHNGYKCSLCDKRFRRSYHVAYHLKIHTTEKKFICPIENCGRGFIDEEYLKRHLEMHTMERTFVCDYENCGKAFQTNRRLASHKYTHRIPKKFVCDMCGHSCRSNTELKTHQRTHTGERPFPCEVCSKPFISKTALTEHMISHSETRPHICAVCNATFASRRVLMRHSFIHSEEKTFKCKLCENAFKHPNSLQGHMRNVHRRKKKRK